MGWRDVGAVWHQVDLKKKTLFLMEKYIEDVKQDEKHMPDLLESIIQPPGLVKEALRPILFKIDKFRHQKRRKRM